MSRTVLTALFVLSGSFSTLFAQDKTPPLPAAAFIDNNTVLVARANIEKLDLKKYFQLMQGFVPNEKEVEQVREQVLAFQAKFLKTGAREIFVIMSLPDINSRPEIFFLVPLPQGADVDALHKLAGLLPGGFVLKKDNVLVVADGMDQQRLENFRPQARPEFAKAMAALAGQPVQAAFVPSDALRQPLEKNVPQLPPELGGGDITLITRGIAWVAMGYDTATLSQKYVVQAKDPAAAKELSALANKALDALSKTREVKEFFPDFAKLRALLDLKVQEDRLTLALDERIVHETLKQAVGKVRSAAGRAQSQNNMRQLALAFHVHHDTNKSFPARANFDANGKALLSWRVHVLPYVEQENLYKEFKLNESWDSPHNKKLIAKIPPIFQSPLSKVGKDGKTLYLVPTGKGTMFDGALGVRIQDIRDGTSNTIMLLEVDDAKAVFWTQPDDFEVNAKDPLAGLVRADLKGFQVCFADGSVRFLAASVRPQTLLALFSIAGGEVVDQDD